MHDHNRQIANLIKQGNIAQVNPSDCLVRVSHGDLLTDWLPYFVPFAGGVSVHRPPSVGENCIVLSPSGEMANGVVLCGMASNQFSSPSNSADETVVAFPDGAKMEYNHVSGSLKVSGVDTVIVEANQKILINCPDNVIDGKLTVKDLFTFENGMAGSNAGGGSAAILTGDVVHTGGSFSSNGVVVDDHDHPETNSGNTGKPNK